MLARGPPVLEEPPLDDSEAAKLVAMAPKPHETWRSRFSGSADRRGIPLGTIVVSVATIILLLDLNAALILGLWVLRNIVVYVIIAFFFTLLMTPATRFLRRHGLSHGGATLTVFLVGLLVRGRPGVPVHRAAGDGGGALQQAGALARERSEERTRPAGPAAVPAASAEVPVRRVGQVRLAAHQGAEAGHRVLGRRGGGVHRRHHRDDRHPHLLHHAGGPPHVARLPRPLPALDGGPPAPGRRRVHPLGHRLHAGQRRHLGHRRDHRRCHPRDPRRALRPAPRCLRGPGRPAAARRRPAWPASRSSSSPPSTRSRPGSPC